MTNNKWITILKIMLLMVLIFSGYSNAQDSTQVEEKKPVIFLKYQNNLLSVDLKSVTIKDIFEEIKKQTGMNYEIEKEIQEQRVTISFKENELTQAIKDILNTIGNPSYMISYKNVGAIGQSPKYVVSGITIKKRGATEATQVTKRELQPGEMEVGQVTDDPKWNAEFKNLKKYRIRAKNVDVNELLEKLSSAIGFKIVACRIDKKIDLDDENSFVVLLDHILIKIRPKIYKTGGQSAEIDRKGNVTKPGYYEVTRLTDTEIRKRREQSELKNAEGERLMEQGKYMEALDAFGKAVDPDYVLPTINEGKIYLLNRQYSNAIENFNLVLEIDSTSSDAWLGLSETYEKNSEVNKAIDSMKKYVLYEKDPKNVEEIKRKIDSFEKEGMMKYYSLIEKGDEHLGKRDIVKAEEQYHEAIKFNPKPVLGYRKLAEMYEHTKDYSKAEEMYQKAIEKDNENFEIYLRLSDLYMLTGRQKEAIEMMKMAVKFCPAKETISKINQVIEVIQKGMKDEK